MRETLTTTPRDDLDKALTSLYGERVPASFQNDWRNAVVREEKQNMSIQKKKKNLWLRGVLPVAAALALVLGAAWVGSQSPEQPALVAGNTTTVTSRSAKNGASSGATLNAAMYTADSSAMEASYDMAMEAPAESSGSGQSVVPSATDSRKLVRTADLTIRTDAYDEDLAAISALISSLGGYAESVNADGETSGGSTRSAHLTVRVPSPRLDEFLNGLGGIGRIVSRSESVEDKTVQYADNEARLKTLREKMNRLNALLGKAEDVADIIEIETAIADTQYAIDSFETTQRAINRDVDMSQVYVSLREDSPVAVTSEMSLGERIGAAFTTSVKGLGRFLRNAVVFLAMALPALAVIAVVIAAAVLIRKSVRKKKESKAEPERQTEPPEEKK